MNASSVGERKCLVVGYTWDDDVPYIQVRELVPQSSVENLLLSDTFYFRKYDERRCIGWVDFTQMEIMPCQDMAEVNATQCEACKQREGFLPCVMCNGLQCPFLKPSVEAYCRQPHHLYLACFGDRRVKVGTASDSRKHVRLLEQGPLMAAYVATASGPLIKQIEHSVSSIGYTESMRRSEKRKMLGSGVGEDEARKYVLDAFEDIATRLPPCYHPYLHAPEFVAMPAVAERSRSVIALDEIELNSGVVIGGTILAARGSFLIIDDGTGAATLDLAGLKSWVVTLNPSGPRTLRQKQLSLF